MTVSYYNREHDAEGAKAILALGRACAKKSPILAHQMLADEKTLDGFIAEEESKEAQTQRVPDGAPVHYERHRPEQSTLYRLVQQHAADFIAHTEASTGGELPRFVKDEFDAFLECGILAHGFLRLRCGECGHDKLLAAQPQLVTPVLQAVQRMVTRHLPSPG